MLLAQTEMISGQPHFTLHVEFPNGRIISVCQGPASYGGKQGLFEAAEMVNGEPHRIEGWLRPSDVEDYAMRLAGHL